jgi:SAM-dependent methyltransferase
MAGLELNQPPKSGSARPSLLDRLDLALLRLAKRKRAHFDDSPQFYEEFFAERDLSAYIRDIRHVWRFSVMRRTFDRTFPGGRATVVDIGSGLGASLFHLPEECLYVGIDISEAALEHARRIHASRKSIFRRGGFPDLPVDSDECDFALCLEVLEHVPDDVQALREIARILKPEGFLLLSVPNTYYWPSYRSLIGHYRHYSRASLDAVLDGAGFEIVERYPSFRGFWRIYYYVYVVLRMFEAMVRQVGREHYSVYESSLYRSFGHRALRRLEIRRGDASDSTFLLCRNSERSVK